MERKPAKRCQFCTCILSGTNPSTVCPDCAPHLARAQARKHKGVYNKKDTWRPQRQELTPEQRRERAEALMPFVHNALFGKKDVEKEKTEMGRKIEGAIEEARKEITWSST